MDRICTLHASIYLPVVLLLSTRRRSPSVQAEHMPASCCLSCNCSMGSTGPPSPVYLPQICLNGDFHFARCGFPSLVMLA